MRMQQLSISNKSVGVSLSCSMMIALIFSCSPDENRTATVLDPRLPDTTNSTIDSSLLYSGDLIYKGAFRMPTGSGGQQSEQRSAGYAYGGTALAFDSVHNSLFLVGHDWYQYVGEISIPSPIITNDKNGLNRATELQPLSDITKSHLNNVAQNGGAIDGCKIGGLLVVGDKLLGTSYVYYDAAGMAKLSHFISSLDLSAAGDFSGMYAIGAQAGFVAGYMTTIPQEWQRIFNADALTGQACLPIISRTSYGPSATSFTLSDVGRKNPAPGNLLVGYPAEHPTLGSWGNSTTSNPVFNMATGVSGVVFPGNTGSVLFFGSTGTGIPLYGEGTSDSTLHGKPVPGTNGQVLYAYDPASEAKGCHSYPYVYYCWAYRATDLADVHNGKKMPWEITPYATWEFELPFAPSSGFRGMGGAAYDSKNRVLYVSQLLADDAAPLIHVFGIRH